MADGCRSVAGDRLGLISTAATARDLDLIRQALGEERIDWFGTSYGTRLGMEYVRRFPDHVRSAVLDGPMDPAEALEAQVRDMAAASEEVLGRALETCWFVDPCPAGDAAVTYDALASHLGAVPGIASDGRPVGVVALQVAAQQAAALPYFWAETFLTALVSSGPGQSDAILAIVDPSDPAGASTFDAYWTR
jgi:pimeloyl-ACP methyl ester carboxylesterase